MWPQAGVSAPPRGPSGCPLPQLSCLSHSTVSHPTAALRSQSTALLGSRLWYSALYLRGTSASTGHIFSHISSPTTFVAVVSDCTAWMGHSSPPSCPCPAGLPCNSPRWRCLPATHSSHPHTAGQRQVNIDDPVCRTEK